MISLWLLLIKYFSYKLKSTTSEMHLFSHMSKLLRISSTLPEKLSNITLFKTCFSFIEILVLSFLLSLIFFNWCIITLHCSENFCHRTNESAMFCVCVCVCVCVHFQLCPTLWSPMDCSSPGSSVYGISQVRILDWVAISNSMGSSQPWDWTCVSCMSSQW